jgi:hypothetical protein
MHRRDSAFHGARVARANPEAAGSLGIRYTQNNRTNISIARRDSVAILDSFVGPKS